MLLGFWAIGCGGGPPSGTPPYSDGETPFVDVSADAGLDFVHVNGMSGRLYFSEMVGPGGALVDYDGDGDLDVYAVQGHPLDRPPRAGNGAAPLDRLYRNDPVGGRAAARSPAGRIGFSLVDVTAEGGL